MTTKHDYTDLFIGGILLFCFIIFCLGVTMELLKFMALIKWVFG
jgi:hypothetical protein